MRRAAKVDENQAAIVSAMRSVGATVWVCAGECGSTERRPPSKATRLMCAPCRFKANKSEGNPNFKNAGNKRCLMCGGHFHSYQQSRVYCSRRCYVLTRPIKPEPCPPPPRIPKPAYCPKPPRESRKAQASCAVCAKSFIFYKSRPRSFCSYPCHIASGGAWRAGMASQKAKMKYGAKKDANHGDIVKALQDLGVSVIDTAHMGQGFPDLVLGWAAQTLLMEIKNPKTTYGRKGLNKNQIRWKDDWRGGPYAVVSSIEGAIAAIKALNGGTVATLTDVEGALRLVASMK